MKNLWQDFSKNQINSIKNQINSMRSAYICFCDTTAGLGERHYDQPRFVFTPCPCTDCALIALTMDCDISTPAFQVSLTSLSIDHIFNSTVDKELHATIPHRMIEAFTRCAIEYGSPESMSWSLIVDTYDDLYPENKFSACHLENYFLQLAFLLTFKSSDDHQQGDQD